MLFSHLHWDHVQGFPFFTPAFVPTTELVLYGPGKGGDRALFAALDKQMQPPGFPVPLSIMGSKMEFRAAEHSFTTGPFKVTPIPLPHPNGCMGYRIDADGGSFIYATDVELSLETLTPAIAEVMRGVDALCLDAQYTPDEYAGRVGVPKKGWGHSTMVDAAKVASAVGAKRLFLFHHDPAHNDETVELMAEQAREYFRASEPAREGKHIFLAAESGKRCA
jgi:phosphoribosyl 1,2-cyclic phosphodiesterase